MQDRLFSSQYKSVAPSIILYTTLYNKVIVSLEEVKRRFSGNLPLLDPVDDMNIKDDAFRKTVRVRINMNIYNMYRLGKV